MSNNGFTWEFIEFINTKDCIQGHTINKKVIFLIFSDGEIIFTTIPCKNNWPDLTLNFYELEEVTKLMKTYLQDNNLCLLNKEKE